MYTTQRAFTRGHNSLALALSLSFSSFLSTLAFPHARRLQVNNNCVDKKLLQTQQRETEMNDVERRGGEREE